MCVSVWTSFFFFCRLVLNPLSYTSQDLIFFFLFWHSYSVIESFVFFCWYNGLCLIKWWWWLNIVINLVVLFTKLKSLKLNNFSPKPTITKILYTYIHVCVCVCVCAERVNSGLVCSDLRHSKSPQDWPLTGSWQISSKPWEKPVWSKWLCIPGPWAMPELLLTVCFIVNAYFCLSGTLLIAKSVWPLGETGFWVPKVSRSSTPWQHDWPPNTNPGHYGSSALAG